MKKIYALFLCMLAFSWLAVVPAAQAQYLLTDYIIRTNHNTFNSVEGQGTSIPELLAGSPYNYYNVSNEITLPFNFRYINLVTNKIKVTSCGTVICGGSAQWPDAQIYDYIPYSYGLYYPQYNSGSTYGYAPDESIRPFCTFAGSVASTSYCYVIQGAAPNRTCTIQSSHVANICDFSLYCSWQVVLYEVGPNSGFVSKIDMNYDAPTTAGTFCEPNGVGIKDHGYVQSNGQLSILTDGYNPADGSVWTFANGGPFPVTTSGYYSNYYVPKFNMSFSILYDRNLSWSKPNSTPADGKILLINNPIVNPAVAPFVNGPSIFLSNEGRLGAPVNPYTAVNVRLVITGDPTNPYDHNVDLTPAQLATLIPFGGLSSIITLPNYTPVNYGLYTMTWSINSSTPTDPFPTDNVFVTSFVVSPPNNIAAIKALSPAAAIAGLVVRTPINIPTPVSFEFRNLGVNDQLNGVPVAVYIKNPSGTIIYRDTQILYNWLSGQTRDTDFKDFTPTQNGTYTICGMAMMTNPVDGNHGDDTVCSQFLVAYEADVAALSVFNPDDQEEKPEKKSFKPGAFFQSKGVLDLFDVPVRVKIMRCSDNTLVYQADTLIPELNVDAGAVKMFFPVTGTAGTYKNIADIPPGCYQLCAIARQANDGDRSNDTACTQFSIIPRLSGNINVGLGQRFQTIAAAVDSLRFRGVKPPGVNLILTDPNYTENGNTSVSTPGAAIDFSNISFTAPDAWITWKPKQGVSPTITFTGFKPNCFSWSYRSCPYMAWDGNNQYSPTADLLTPEPAKRGITIINQSTVPGSIFDMEYGRHDLRFKNLRLVNNGNLTNANSHVINMVNIYTFNSFVTGVNDTASQNFITFDNNEIGNANIGIWDVGSIPLFDINQAVFFPKRNHDNRITRNTIGTQANPIGAVGIHLGNEDGTYVGHNEISWVNGYAASTYGGAISVIDGNTANMWVDANKIHNIRSSTPAIPGTPNTLVGIDIQQPATIYTQGTGTAQKKSTLPIGTRNRITNNMIYDMRVLNAPTTTVLPITISTGAASYFIDNDSVFNNSLAVSNAPALITVTRMGRPFLWNNILQNLNTSASATAVVYNLTVPRPMLASVSSNYNDIDFRNASIFATLSEVDRTTGTFIQTKTFKSLNDWRSYTQQDISSVTGDPMFRADSLHLPAATTYILSPASNNGKWLGTGTQTLDFDGDARLVANNTPDIGADEFEGFQYVNDLAVQVITKPAGITDNTGVVSVTAENPLAIQAIVKNQGSIAASNRNVYAKVEVSIDGGLTWNQYAAPKSFVTLSGLHFDVAETKTLDFVGPNITGEAGKLFRVTVSVDPDQYNPNNSLTKVFKLLVKRAAVLLSYENSTAQGQKNKDSLAMALQRLGVPYDSINRVTYGAGPIDYTPWWTMVWSTGNPDVPYAQPLGIGAVSLKETEEIDNFFRAGQTYAKKSFVIAGENIAKYNDPTSVFSQVNNPVTDAEFMSTWLHTQFVARFPGNNWPVGLPVQYRGVLKGVGNYFKFPDSLLGTNIPAGGGPNVIKVNPSTGTVGDNISRVAYTYAPHPSTPLDSGGGTAWTGSTFNVVFYPFDWSDPFQTVGTRDGDAGVFPANVSGTTRFLRGALDFIQSFHGTVLPVEFSSVKGTALKTGNEITWSVAAQKSVDHYEVEMLSGNDWNWVGEAKASSATDYSFLHTAQAAFAVGKTFTYRIVSVDLDGARTTSMTTSFDRTAQGSEFSLEQNFPNPFGTSTAFSFTLPENGTVSLRILDMTGKVVATPISSVDYAVGKNQFKLNAGNLASGTYVYELSFVNGNGEISTLSRKMTLSK